MYYYCHAHSMVSDHQHHSGYIPIVNEVFNIIISEARELCIPIEYYPRGEFSPTPYLRITHGGIIIRFSHEHICKFTAYDIVSAVISYESYTTLAELLYLD